ncbi:MAG: ABC transporter ATP-binding protein [Terriglobales bacterium]
MSTEVSSPQGPIAAAREPRAAVEIRNLVKDYGPKRALDGVSLELREREILGLLGPNGAGKTTLVRSLVGRVVLTSGSVSILGAAVGTPAARAALGYVPQELALYPMLTAEENLEVFGSYQGLAGSALKQAIAWCLEWSALQDRAREPVKQLSGGMKRRLNMAAGLIHHPAIVLFDEPTVGVDPQSRERIYAMIEELHRAGVSAIYTTHYMEEAERLCDRIAIVDHGRVIALGTNAELVRDAFGQQCEVAIHLGAEPSAAGAAWITEHGGRREGLAVHFTVSSPADEVSALLGAARDQQLEVRDLSLKTPNLESVFLHLTGRELRE